MRYDLVVRGRAGTPRHVQHVDEIEIPDLLPIAVAVEAKASGKGGRDLTLADADAIIETWSLCYALLKHVRRVCSEPRTEE